MMGTYERDGLAPREPSAAIAPLPSSPSTGSLLALRLYPARAAYLAMVALIDRRCPSQEGRRP
jgi:hypothetical protein